MALIETIFTLVTALEFASGTNRTLATALEYTSGTRTLATALEFTSGTNQDHLRNCTRIH